MEVTTANGQGNLIERDVDHMHPYADGVSMTEHPKIPGSVLPQVQQVCFSSLILGLLDSSDSQASKLLMVYLNHVKTLDVLLQAEKETYRFQTVRREESNLRSVRSWCRPC